MKWFKRVPAKPRITTADVQRAAQEFERLGIPWVNGFSLVNAATGLYNLKEPSFTEGFMTVRNAVREGLIEKREIFRATFYKAINS